MGCCASIMPVGGTIAWASTTGRLAAGTSVVAVAGDGKFIAAATSNAGAAIRVLLAHPIHRSSQSKVVSQLAPYECRTDCAVKKAPTVLWLIPLRRHQIPANQFSPCLLQNVGRNVLVTSIALIHFAFL